MGKDEFTDKASGLLCGVRLHYKIPGVGPLYGICICSASFQRVGLGKRSPLGGVCLKGVFVASFILFFLFPFFFCLVPLRIRILRCPLWPGTSFVVVCYI